jgi:hypothetical protein
LGLFGDKVFQSEMHRVVVAFECLSQLRKLRGALTSNANKKCLSPSLVGEGDLVKDPILHERRDECGVPLVLDDWTQLLQLLFVHSKRLWT